MKMLRATLLVGGLWYFLASGLGTAGREVMMGPYLTRSDCEFFRGTVQAVSVSPCFER